MEVGEGGKGWTTGRVERSGK